VREIHTRMPVILPEEHRDAWLSGEAGKKVLAPYRAEQMKAWPVSARVNSPKNNDAEITAPIVLTAERDWASDPFAETLL
jgi:putative SOS response-associated peptidase YedK